MIINTKLYKGLMDNNDDMNLGETPDLVSKLYRITSTSTLDELAQKYTMPQLMKMMVDVFSEEIETVRESALLENAALKAQIEKNKKIVGDASERIDQLLPVLAAKNEAIRTGLPEDREKYLTQLEYVVREQETQLKTYFAEILGLINQAKNQMQSSLETTRRYRKERKDLEESLKQIPRAQTATKIHDDKLSKLHSATYGIKQLEEIVIKGIQNGQPVSVSFGDVDYFKQYNETYRHAQGDQALHMIEDVVSEGHRASDLVFRFGGDEIIFIFPDTEKDKAYMKMDQIREKIKRAEIKRLPQIVREKEPYHGNRSYKHITMSAVVIDATALDISKLRQQNEQSNREELEHVRAEAQSKGITEELSIEKYVKDNYRPYTLGNSIIQHLSEILETAKKDGRDKVLLG